MERVFINRELDGIGVGKPMLVDTGDRELRLLVHPKDPNQEPEVEERPKGKTVEYRYLAKSAHYVPIYDQTPHQQAPVASQGMSIQELIKFWN